MAILCFQVGPGVYVQYDDAGSVVCYQLAAGLYFQETAGGATQLTVQNSQCVVTSDNVALVQHHVLAVQNSQCVVTSSNVALTQHHVLTVQNSQCIVASSNVVLTYHAAGGAAGNVFRSPVFHSRMFSAS